MQHPHLSPPDARIAVQTIIDLMAQTLAAASRIEIRGFGRFTVNHRPAREGRNPRTGEIVHVPVKWVPHFRPGKELRERVASPKL
jgi:integration host factor subunit beta